jgi:hypothetical protein
MGISTLIHGVNSPDGVFIKTDSNSEKLENQPADVGAIESVGFTVKIHLRRIGPPPPRLVSISDGGPVFIEFLTLLIAPG